MAVLALLDAEVQFVRRRTLFQVRVQAGGAVRLCCFSTFDPLQYKPSDTPREHGPRIGTEAAFKNTAAEILIFLLLLLLFLA